MGSILITGGTGYIGSHTCLILLEKGVEIFVIDSLINSSEISLKKVLKICSGKDPNILKKVHFRKGDIRNKAFLINVFEEAKNLKKEIEGVIHFAGRKSIRESFDDLFNYWDVNVNGSMNLLNVMNENNCHTFVFSSTANVYSFSNLNNLKEDSLINPNSPYGKSKSVVESFLNQISEYSNKSWKIACLRYFNPIGAHHSGEIGEDPQFRSDNIFPLILDAAYYKNKELMIYGNDWDTLDGTAIRDYVHVMDVAYAHNLALDFLINKEKIHIKLNIGTGEGVSVLELIKRFEMVNNVKVPYIFKERRKGDVQCLIADNSYAHSVLGWSPKKNIEDMCRDGWLWKKMNPKGY